MLKNKMDKKSVLLTVPHAICPINAPETSHRCDFLAIEAAQCIYNIALITPETHVIIERPFIPKDTSRDECDLNRRWCDMKLKVRDARAHGFRKRIRNFVLEHNDEIIFVLDVHSYPPDVHVWRDYLVFILDDDEDRNSQVAPYVTDFVSFMNSNGIPTASGIGRNNDLHYEMRTSLGKNSMLIEFNEILLGQRDLLEKICTFIVLWFNKIV